MDGSDGLGLDEDAIAFGSEPRVTHVGVHQGLEVNDMVGIALR